MESMVSPARRQHLSIGNLHVEEAKIGIGKVRWAGVELLRGVSYPIRDSDWGSIPITVTNERVDCHADSVTLQQNFSAWNGAIKGTFDLEAKGSGHIQMCLSFDFARQVTLCRAGFVVLHPIVGLAGERVIITHTDRGREETTFPKAISPSQPARDIAGLQYTIDGCAISIDLGGDTFEMEDQRNWSDASYKTYCRPLSQPFPYKVEAGTKAVQTIDIVLRGSPTRTGATGATVAMATIHAEPTGEPMPGVALAVETSWSATLPPNLRSIPRLVRLDLNSDDRSLLHGVDVPFDLELVTADDISIAREQLRTLAEWLGEAGLIAHHVVALPRAYLQSYQPDAVWPAGASPAELATAARLTFPGARIGGGMLTNFAEFNRCRPDPARVDYVTHGSSAIVHAADTRSVFETIEALPQMFASGRAIAAGKSYRLGLVAIGMRSNPYGNGLAANADGALRTMTADDPRARTRVGAAWLVAAMAATAGAAIEQVALCAPAGPFGIIEDDGSVRPSYHVVRALHAMAGMPRTDRHTASSIAVVSASVKGATKAIVANLTESDVVIPLGDGAVVAVLDAATEQAAADDDWLDHASALHSSQLRLGSYAIAFVTIPTALGVAA